MPDDHATGIHASMLRMLAGSDFFGGLDPTVAGHIASLARIRRVKAGELVFQKGDPGDALYAVRQGQIRIVTGTAAGRSLTLNLLGPGDLFGEIALLDGHQRTADAVASETSELLYVPRSAFIRLLESEPQVSTSVIGFLCSRLRWMSERMEETNLAPLPARLAARLLALSEDYGSEIVITQEELAQFVRSSRERVNRQLRVWRRRGAVEIGRNRIRIVDQARLL